MSVPKWAVGMRVLTPGVYVDKDQGLHLDERELCRQAGAPYTLRNAETVRKAFQEAFPMCKTEVVEEP
jgi:hypothetical protein